TEYERVFGQPDLAPSRCFGRNDFLGIVDEVALGKMDDLLRTEFLPIEGQNDRIGNHIIVKIRGHRPWKADVAHLNWGGSMCEDCRTRVCRVPAPVDRY